MYVSNYWTVALLCCLRSAISEYGLDNNHYVVMVTMQTAGETIFV